MSIAIGGVLLSGYLTEKIMTTELKRVCAMRNSNSETAFVYGYGVVTEAFNEDLGFMNPKITLDNGGVVWGYECWWFDVERAKEIIGDRKIEFVELPERAS